MTSLPPNADELVSAYVDGEAAPDEIAVIEASDDLMAQVQALRQLTDAMSVTPATPAPLKEAHLAAAMSAFDELMASDDRALDGADSPSDAPDLAVVRSTDNRPTAAATPDGTISLQERRQQKRMAWLNPRIVAAAAAVLLLVGIAAISLQRSGEPGLDVADGSIAAVEASSSDAAADDVAEDRAMESAQAEDGDAASMAEPADDAMEEAMAEEDAMAAEIEEEADEAMDDAMEEAEDAMEESEPAEAPAVDADSEGETADAAAGSSADADEPENLTDNNFFLGDFESVDELTGQLGQDNNTSDDLAARTDDLAQGLFSSCQDAVAVLAGADGATIVGTATIADEPVEVHVLDGGPVVVVDATRCDIVSEFDLSPS